MSACCEHDMLWHNLNTGACSEPGCPCAGFDVSSLQFRTVDDIASEADELRATVERMREALAGVLHFARPDIRRGPAIPGWEEAVAKAEKELGTPTPEPVPDETRGPL